VQTACWVIAYSCQGNISNRPPTCFKTQILDCIDKTGGGGWVGGWVRGTWFNCASAACALQRPTLRCACTPPCAPHCARIAYAVRSAPAQTAHPGSIAIASISEAASTSTLASLLSRSTLTPLTFDRPLRASSTRELCGWWRCVRWCGVGARWIWGSSRCQRGGSNKAWGNQPAATHPAPRAHLQPLHIIPSTLMSSSTVSAPSSTLPVVVGRMGEEVSWGRGQNAQAAMQRPPLLRPAAQQCRTYL